MPKKTLELKPLRHLSYSSKDTLDRCAKAYFLTRMTDAPQRPALWLAAGSAVHKVTEHWDRAAIKGIKLTDGQILQLWITTFDSEVADLRQKEPDEMKWRQSKSEPVEIWRQMGLQQVKDYIAWRERTPWQIWTTPDGSPAIELDVSGMLPGCGVEIKGYVDRVFHDPNLDQLTVVDIKSGTRQPDSDAQFGTYSGLFEAKYGRRANTGAAFMTRKAALGKVFDLSKYTMDYVGLIYGRTEAQIQAGAFNPKLGSHCWNICDVADSCYAYDGELAERWDPDHPGYAPPF